MNNFRSPNEISVLTPWGLFTALEFLDELENIASNSRYDLYDIMWAWYEKNRSCFEF